MQRGIGAALGRLGRRGLLIGLGCAVGIAAAGGVALATVPDGAMPRASGIRPWDKSL